MVTLSVFNPLLRKPNLDCNIFLIRSRFQIFTSLAKILKMVQSLDYNYSLGPLIIIIYISLQCITDSLLKDTVMLAALLKPFEDKKVSGTFFTLFKTCFFYYSDKLEISDSFRLNLHLGNEEKTKKPAGPSSQTFQFGRLQRKKVFGLLWLYSQRAPHRECFILLFSS